MVHAANYEVAVLLKISINPPASCHFVQSSHHRNSRSLYPNGTTIEVVQCRFLAFLKLALATAEL